MKNVYLVIILQAFALSLFGGMNAFQGIEFGSAPTKKVRNGYVEAKDKGNPLPTIHYAYTDKNRLWQIARTSDPLKVENLDYEKCAAEMRSLKAMLEKECGIVLGEAPRYVSKAVPPTEREKWSRLNYQYADHEMTVYAYVDCGGFEYGPKGNVFIEFIVSDLSVFGEDQKAAALNDNESATGNRGTVTRGKWLDTKSGIIWMYQLTGGEATITSLSKGSCHPENVIIPSHIGMKSYPVTGLGITAMKGVQWVKSVTIPETVKTIGQNRSYPMVNCFARSMLLRQIKVSKGNLYFESDGSALYTKGRNTLVAVPAGLKTFVIPDGVEKIGTGAFGTVQFGQSEVLTSVKIPSSVKIISDWAFHGCSALTEVSMAKDGVESIGEFAFGWNNSLKRLDIPCTVTNLAGGSISGSTNLQTVVFHSVAMPTVRLDKNMPSLRGLHSECVVEIPKDASRDWQKLENLGLKIKRY